MNTTSGFAICSWIPPQDSQYVYKYHLRIRNMFMNTTSGFARCLWIPPQDSQYVYEYHLRISNMLMNTTSGFAICLWIPPQDSQYVCEYHLRLVMRKHQKKSKDLTAARSTTKNEICLKSHSVLQSCVRPNRGWRLDSNPGLHVPRL